MRQWAGILAVVLLLAATLGATGLAWQVQAELGRAITTAQDWRDVALTFHDQADDAEGRAALCHVALKKAMKLLLPIERPNRRQETGRSSGGKAGRPTGSPRRHSSAVPPTPPTWRRGRPWA